MMFFILIFFATIKLSLTELTYNNATCSDTSSFDDDYIYPNTITYFRSPNFPVTMYNSTLICNARFNTITQTYKLWFVIFNGEIGSFTVFNKLQNITINDFDENDFFMFAPSTYPFTFKFVKTEYYNAPSNWIAFESIVYAYASKNLCPFSEQLTNLTNNEVIPIASNYNLNDTNQNPNCKWTFLINLNQTLKIVFKYLVIANHTVLQLKTDGNILDVFGTQIDSYDPKVYYYLSNSGIFTLSYNDSTTLYTNFFALISAVDKNPNSPKQLCQFNATEIFTIIEYIDYNHGYSAFDSCNYQILISKNYEIVLDVKVLIAEKNVDKLTLNDQSGTMLELYKDDTYYLTFDANGTILDFSADGNIQQAGFIVQQRMLYCECTPSNVVIPCNGYFKITLIKDTSYYCSNMACNFTINLEEPCNDTFINLKFNLNLRKNDFAILTQNGKIIDNFTISSPLNVERIFSKTTNVSLQFISGNALASIYAFPHYLSILGGITNPKILSTIQLTETLPYHFQRLKYLSENDAFVICGEKNDTLELFVPSTYQASLEPYVLYDSDKMDNFIGDLNSPLITTSDPRYPRHINSTSGCFTIYIGNSDDIYLFFRMKKTHSKNCKNTNNIFSIFGAGDIPIDGTANESGFCDLILLLFAGYMPAIKFFNIKPSSNEIFKVSSPINQKTYFLTNSTDAKMWKGTTIYSPILSITIPPNENISATLLLPDTPVVVNLLNTGNKGIFASPNYGGFVMPMYNSYPLYSLFSTDQIYNIELNVKNMDGSGTLIFTNEYENIIIQPNQTISINGTNFHLVYQNLQNFTFLIEYAITSFYDTTSSTLTSSATATTSPSTKMLPTTPPFQQTSVTSNSISSHYFIWLNIIAILVIY